MEALRRQRQIIAGVLGILAGAILILAGLIYFAMYGGSCPSVAADNTLNLLDHENSYLDEIEKQYLYASGPAPDVVLSRIDNEIQTIESVGIPACVEPSRSALEMAYNNAFKYYHERSWESGNPQEIVNFNAYLKARSEYKQEAIKIRACQPLCNFELPVSITITIKR